MDWGDENLEEILNFDSKSLLMPKAIVQYIAGVVTRERERLAVAIENNPNAADLASAIRDESQDHLIFRWQRPTAKP